MSSGCPSGSTIGGHATPKCTCISACGPRLKTTTAEKSGNNYATGRLYWKCGITGGDTVVLMSSATSVANDRVSGHVPPRPDVHEIFNKRYGVEWHVGHRYWRPVVSAPKFRICGYEIFANKGDNGSWRTVSGGTEDHLEVHFGSDYDRGIDWTLRVWGIPAELVAFEAPALLTVAKSKRWRRPARAAKAVKARRARVGKQAAAVRGAKRRRSRMEASKIGVLPASASVFVQMRRSQVTSDAPPSSVSAVAPMRTPLGGSLSGSMNPSPLNSRSLSTAASSSQLLKVYSTR